MLGHAKNLERDWKFTRLDMFWQKAINVFPVFLALENSDDLT